MNRCKLSFIEHKLSQTSNSIETDLIEIKNMLQELVADLTWFQLELEETTFDY